MTDNEWNKWEYYHKVTGLYSYADSVDNYSKHVVQNISNSFTEAKKGSWIIQQVK